MAGIKIISKKEYCRKFGKPNQEKVWDNISDIWNDYRKKPFFRVEEFLMNASPYKGKQSKIAGKIKVLDLGCGCGRNMIASEYMEYYGVDFSSSQIKCAIERARELGITAKFFKMEADKLFKEFRNEMFDCGLFIATLHCIEGTGKRLKAVKEFYRVLKKGAEGLISVWNGSDPRFDIVGNHGDIYMSWKKGSRDYMRYYYIYSKPELLELLKSVGFSVLKVYENDEDNGRFGKKNLIVKVKKSV